MLSTMMAAENVLVLFNWIRNLYRFLSTFSIALSCILSFGFLSNNDNYYCHVCSLSFYSLVWWPSLSCNANDRWYPWRRCLAKTTVVRTTFRPIQIFVNLTQFYKNFPKSMQKFSPWCQKMSLSETQNLRTCHLEKA